MGTRTKLRMRAAEQLGEVEGESEAARAAVSAEDWPLTRALTGIAFGVPRLGATFTKIDIELPIYELTNTVATAYVQTRPVANPAVVRTHLDLWPIRPTVAADIIQYGTQAALYGCAFKHTPGTAYEVLAHVQDAGGNWARLYLGTVTTRHDATPDAATLAATRYVGTGGSDDAKGTTIDTAWASTQKAWSTLPSGGVAVFGPGFYGPTSTGRSLAGAFRTEFPCVNSGGKDGMEINQGQQSVIEPRSVAAPAGTPPWTTSISTNPYSVAPWQPVPEYPGLWCWSTVPGTNIDVHGIAQVGYASTREEYPRKVAYTRRDTKLCATALGWAEILYTNRDYNDGGAYQASDGKLYLKLPSHAPSQNPNDLWIKAGGESVGFDVNGPNIRISGFKIHCMAWGVQVRHPAAGSRVDHCHFSMAQNGVRWGNGTAASNSQNMDAYTRDNVVEHCLFEEANLWSQDHQAIPWRCIKSTVILQNNLAYTAANGFGGAVVRWAALENTAVSGRGGGVRSTFRHSRVVGWFNGFSPCGSVSGEGRYAGYGSECHDVRMEQLSDDGFEFDAQGINQAAWNNTLRNVLVFVSLGPADLGPLYFFQNDVQLSRRGIGLKRTEADAAAANLACVVVKHSGGSSPRLLCHLIHNTVWSNEGDVWGPAEVASPTGPSEEALFLKNNLIRVSGWVVRRDASQPYTEDFNILASDGFGSSTNWPIRWNGTRIFTTAEYRAISGQGAHSNLIDGRTINPTDVAAVDALLTHPATGNLSLTTAAHIQVVGTPIPGISDDLGRVPRVGYQP